jgi:hypothetical protein
MKRIGGIFFKKFFLKEKFFAIVIPTEEESYLKYIFQKSKLLNAEYFGHYQKKNGLQDASHSGGFTIVIPTKEESYFKCLFHNSAFYLMIP